jgi:hypothetical protein
MWCCNIYLKGNWAEYYKVMISRHGQQTVEGMINSSRELTFYDVSDFKTIVEKYTNLTKKMMLL